MGSDGIDIEVRIGSHYYEVRASDGPRSNIIPPSNFGDYRAPLRVLKGGHVSQFATPPSQVFDAGKTVDPTRPWRSSGDPFPVMKLASEDMRLFEIACADSANTHAQELLNVFAVETAAQVLEQLSVAPLGVMADLFTHLWRAVEAEGSGWSVSFEVVKKASEAGMSIAE